MWTAVIMISFLVFVVAIGGTLVMAIKRKPVWKKWLATSGASFAMMVIGAAQLPPVDSSTTNVPSPAAVTEPQAQGFLAAPITTPTPAAPETNTPADQSATVAARETEASQPNSTPSQSPAPSTKSSTTATVDPSTTKTAQPAATTSPQPTTTAKTVSPTPTPVTSSQNITVYVGKTGTKYHYQDCRTLKDAKIPMSINEAKSKGRTACGVCKPPQ